MASLTLRPTSASGTKWSNIANAYDGDTTTSATVKTTSSTYTDRAGTFTFDTSAIPSVATINSATLHVNCKCGSSDKTKLYADINGNESNRVIDKAVGKSQTNTTADITNYISSLNTIKLMQYNTKSSSYTFTLYEIYIEVDYTFPSYTVRFLDWDNSVISTQTITYGSNATPPPNPTRVGYTFSGWSGNYTNVTADVDIIAQYTQNSSGGDDTSVKNIKIGNSTINKLYLGTSQIVKVYLGDILLYSNSTRGN